MDGWAVRRERGVFFSGALDSIDFSVANHVTPTAYDRKNRKTGASDMGIDWPELLNPPIRTPESLSLFPISFYRKLYGATNILAAQVSGNKYRYQNILSLNLV